jgi:signal transduction histidine kinase/ActR/RegA family two-component response regulator
VPDFKNNESNNEPTSVGDTVRIFVRIAIPVTVAWAVVYSIILPHAWLRSCLQAAACIGVGLFAYALSRTRHVRLAASVMVAALWFLIAASALSAGGVRAPAFLAFATLTLLAGVLLGSRAGAVVAVLSIAFGAVLVQLARSGALPSSSVTHTPLSVWLASSLIIIVTATLQYLSARMVRLNQARARAAENELEASEHRYRGIFETVAVALFEIEMTAFSSWREAWQAEHPGLDLRAQLDVEPELVDTIAALIRIRQVNEEAVRLLELDDGSMLHDTFLKLFQPANRKLVAGIAAGLGREPIMRAELPLRTYRGRVRRVLISARCPLAPAELDRLIVGGLDVTEQRLLEERAQTAQRMEAIGRLAGGVAHDFNNALVVIMSWADLLRDPNRNREEGLEAIARSAQRAAQLTRQLLSIGRRQVSTPGTANLAAQVAETMSSLARVLPADLTLQLTNDSEASVTLDATQLEQLLLNLVFNARDAMTGGGTLYVSTRAARPDEVADLPFDRKYAVLSVRDTGIGMDAATKERIFDPFFTTKEHGKGTGLGLSTVHAIVAQSQGKIMVDSVPAKGTCFTVVLPIAPPATQPAQAHAAAQPVEHVERNILLVDDEPLVRDVMQQALKGAGYHVLAAPDAEAALALLRSTHVRVDLLCTDGILPGIGVKQLIDDFRQRYPRAPVVVCSGHIEEELVRRQIAQGDYAFIAKPFTPQELVRKIAEQIVDV